MKSMQLGEILKRCEAVLKKAGIGNPRSESEYIVSSSCDIPPLEFFLLGKERLVGQKEANLIDDAIERRIRNEPLQYIFRKAYFRDLELEVGPGVLIPRPETEQLVGIVIRNSVSGAKVCDVGTGSGAIPLSLAYEKKLECVGLDLSPLALAYAEKNREKYKLPNVSFLISDLFSAFKCENRKFDVITANLPYVTTAEFAELPCEIRGFEPTLALEAGTGGLDVIRLLVNDAWKYLGKGGFAILEISPHQKEPLETSLLENGNYKDIIFEKDLNGDIRFCHFKNIN